jgi:transcriptional regulator with XRE-family HTH domain
MANEYIADAIAKKKINHYRKLNNMSVFDLAIKIGITENKLAQTMHSARVKSVPLDVVKKCAIIFNVTIEELVN